jgi:DnaJ-class molecular chaperone
MTNKSFRDYINLIENAQREGGLEQHMCDHCNGTGRMVRDPDIGTDQECFVCDGTGYVNDEQLDETTPDAIAKVEQLFRHK